MNLNSFNTPIIACANEDVKAIDEQQKYFKKIANMYKDELKQKINQKRNEPPKQEESLEK